MSDGDLFTGDRPNRPDQESRVGDSDLIGEVEIGVLLLSGGEVGGGVTWLANGSWLLTRWLV